MVPADGSVMRKTLFSLKLLLDTRTRLSDFDPDEPFGEHLGLQIPKIVSYGRTLARREIKFYHRCSTLEVLDLMVSFH